MALWLSLCIGKLVVWGVYFFTICHGFGGGFYLLTLNLMGLEVFIFSGLLFVTMSRYGPAGEILVFITYAKMPITNSHAD